MSTSNLLINSREEPPHPLMNSSCNLMKVSRSAFPRKYLDVAYRARCAYKRNSFPVDGEMCNIETTPKT